MQFNKCKDEQAQHATVSHCSSHLPDHRLHCDVTPSSSDATLNPRRPRRCLGSSGMPSGARSLARESPGFCYYCRHNSNNKSTANRTVGCIPDCAQWMVNNLKKGLLFPFFLFSFSCVWRSMKSFCISIRFLDGHFGTEAQTNTPTSSRQQHHDCFLSRGIQKQNKKESGSPLVTFAAAHSSTDGGGLPGLEVNHRGLGQVFSSLENSLHMTHFRYPQILSGGGGEQTSPAH